VVGRRWSAAGGRDLRVRTRIDALRRGCTRDVTYRAQGHLVPHGRRTGRRPIPVHEAHRSEDCRDPRIRSRLSVTSVYIGKLPGTCV